VAHEEEEEEWHVEIFVAVGQRTSGCFIAREPAAQPLSRGIELNRAQQAVRDFCIFTEIAREHVRALNNRYF
jgi:hypothetical protein